MPAVRAGAVIFGFLMIGLCPLMADQCCAGQCAPITRCAWGGIYPTVLTSWSCEGGVDEASLKAQIEYQLDGGVHGLLVLGTIGEGEYATTEERAQVLKVAVETAKGRVPVVAGIHTCNFHVAKDQLTQAKELGAGAVLVKYVGNPDASPDEVQAFFQGLADLHLLPIFYYHYPSQTGVQLCPHEVAAILQIPGVVGIKESTLDLRETERHIALAGPDKVFLSGTALNLTQFMEIGGHGAMCPEAALLPGPTVQAYEAFLQGDRKRARAIQRELFVIAPLLRGGIITERGARVTTMVAQDHKVELPMGDDHPQARLKAALNGLGICTPALVSCPLPQLNRHDRMNVRSAVRKMQKIDIPAACCTKEDTLAKWPLPPVFDAKESESIEEKE